MSIKSRTPGIASDIPLISKQRNPNYVMGNKEENMPLIKSGSKEAVGKNISQLESESYPKKQAVAIALNTARKSGSNIHKPRINHSNHRHKEHR